jgi:hypothetical protein
LPGCSLNKAEIPVGSRHFLSRAENPIVARASVWAVTAAVRGTAELQRTLADNDHSRFFHWVEAPFCAAGILAFRLLAFRPFTF